MHSPRPHRGLTLLEMIVTLLIASLIVLVTFQSLHVFAVARERVAAYGATLDRNRLVLGWLRDSSESLIAVPKPVFKGDAKGFEGTVTAPVLERAGVPTPVRWRIDASGLAALDYREFDGKPLLLPLPEGGQLHFEYFDASGKPHDQWPPALGEHPDLPAAIALLAGPDGDHPLLIAAILGARKPWLQPGPFDAAGDE